jgi:tellurite resistance protein
MAFFLITLLSLVLGLWSAFALSSVSRMRRQAAKALENYRAAVNDLNRHSSSFGDALNRVTAKYIEGIRVARLRAIAVDELRNHKKGLLLQRLKDAGLYTLADLRGWDANRLMSVRGVGPTSAVNIASVLSMVSAGSWNKPIPHPTTPFPTEMERSVIQAVYRDRWFKDVMAGKLMGYQKGLEEYTDRFSSALQKTKFYRWLVSMFDGSVLQIGVSEVQNLTEELEGSHSASGRCDEVTSNIELCARTANKEVEPQILVDDFNSNRGFYERVLLEKLGKPGNADLVKLAVNSNEPVTIPIPMQPPAPSRPIPKPPVAPIQFTFHSSQSGTSFQGSNLWVPEGKDVKVHGYTIPGGMVYLGHVASNQAGSCVDPSLIDPTLPVADNANCHDDLMGYWPSYSAVSPQARAAYLQWLSTGKSDPEAEIGYVFLYFYGLERRLFSFSSLDPGTTPEVDTIRKEIERLAKIYGGSSSSFAGYSSSLLDYLEAKKKELPTLNSVSAPPPPRRGYNPPLRLRIGLGVHAQASKPLPSDWAFCCYLSNSPAAFDANLEEIGPLFYVLFSYLYKESFGEGVVLSSASPKIQVSHRFGNLTLAGTNAFIILPFPDSILDSESMNALRGVGNSALSAVRRYSGFCREFPDQTKSIAALGLLPPEIWPVDIRDAYNNFRSGPPKVLKFNELPGSPPAGVTLARSRMVLFTERLAAFGLGIEPDLRLGGPIPGLDDPIAIFSAAGLEKRNTVSKHFNGAALLLQLASVVAASSEGFCEEEASLILGYLNSERELPANEQQRLAARLAIYRQYPPSTAGVKKQIAAVNGETREAIGNFLVEVALADGTVDPSEVRALEETFKVLGLERTGLYRKIHKAETNGPPSSEANRKVISDAGLAAPANREIQFDSKRVAALRSESVRIAEILDKVFERSEEANSEIQAVGSKDEDDRTLLGLDPEHADLLRVLLDRPRWSRTEVEQLCAGRNLMVDGAVERINEAGFTQFDVAVIEGDDPIDINQDLLVKEIA